MKFKSEFSKLVTTSYTKKNTRVCHYWAFKSDGSILERVERVGIQRQCL